MCESKRVALLYASILGSKWLASYYKSMVGETNWSKIDPRFRGDKPPSFEDLLQMSDQDLADLLSGASVAVESEHEASEWTVEKASNVDVLTAHRLVDMYST